MEEILSSIRRIITDDEAGQARTQRAAPQVHQDDESLEGEADSQIIDDIARVLSGGGSVPASSLWWDGFSIAKNISDEDAEASFRAMVHGIRPEVAQEHAEVTAWLIKGYQPTPAAVGVFETAKAGAKPYPMVPYMGLLHTALGNELGEFMQGGETAEQALADVTQAYNTAAKEGGFLN